jgi:hypothetical protein
MDHPYLHRGRATRFSPAEPGKTIEEIFMQVSVYRRELDLYKKFELSFRKIDAAKATVNEPWPLADTFYIARVVPGRKLSVMGSGKGRRNNLNDKKVKYYLAIP